MSNANFKISHGSNFIKIVSTVSLATILVNFDGKQGVRANSGLEGEGTNDDPKAKQEKSYMSHLTKFIENFTHRVKGGKNMAEKIAIMAEALKEIGTSEYVALWRTFSNKARRHFDDGAVMSHVDFQKEFFYEGCRRARIERAERNGQTPPKERGAKTEAAAAPAKKSTGKKAAPSPKAKTQKPVSKKKSAPKAKAGKKAAAKIEVPANLVTEQQPATTPAEQEA